MKKIEIQKVKVKTLALSDYNQLFDKEFFRANCIKPDFIYTLLVYKGYVHKTQEVEQSTVSKKYNNKKIFCKHQKYEDGLDCYIFHGEIFRFITVEECITQFKIKPNCVLLMKLDSYNDGLYLFKGKEVKAVKVIDVYDKFKGF
ncbi:MAG: hypothetical protein IJ419_14740 [Agathobacter sp.]|nr:hypothetical protein [Agathobacter sp.]